MSKGSCFQSRDVTGGCDVCKAPVTLMHLPVRPLGFFCEKHCPVCKMNAEAPVETAASRRSEARKPEPGYLHYYRGNVVRAVAQRLSAQHSAAGARAAAGHGPACS